MTAQEHIQDLFGSFRAEWLRDDIYKLFSEPTYFPHLLGNKSCVLIGGRGSGKTTVLKCLSYEGQDALGKQNLDQPFSVGVYYRVNTNIVTAFDGPELTESEWIKIYGHFLNLTICSELANYIVWYQSKKPSLDISHLTFARIGESLGVGSSKNITELRKSISDALVALEIYVNNIGSDRPTISQLQSPITYFLNTLRSIPGHQNTAFHIILDEYENMLNYQQRIVNTLIKHSGDNCYFKIGVRELGWRERVTLNSFEALTSPADYELIHIEDRLKDDFPVFAKMVCESRLKGNDEFKFDDLKIEHILPSISTLEEAEKLGVARRAIDIRRTLTEYMKSDKLLQNLHDFQIYCFYELNNRDNLSTVKDLTDYANRDRRALDKFQNYSHALLYTIADKGKQITKHYCGHDTLARISHRNIRFYMQLIHECVLQQISRKKKLTEPIDCSDQTIAAQRVGLNYLRELEGVTARGSQLSKLILGFGRYFHILAENPIGGAPECNQFHIREADGSSTETIRQDAEELLRDGVMHLALVRSPGTKLAAESDTREYDYSPHPIFSPFFAYSSRRKRKISISDIDLVSMYKNPQSTIKRLLGQDKSHLADEGLPTQMSMFNEFFQ